MPLLNILRYPDARLHKLATPVTVFDDGLKKLVADMAETMYEAPGIGLAATQVDVHKQVIVGDGAERRDSLVVLVNPQIVEATGVSDIEEGCLSVPGIYELVERAERVKVGAHDQNGNPFRLEAPGRPAGRGLRPLASAVKRFATARRIPVLQPRSLKGAQEIEQARAQRPDALVVAAYGLLLPQEWLNAGRFGALNIHASLLPRWRGAAPVPR